MHVGSDSPIAESHIDHLRFTLTRFDVGIAWEPRLGFVVWDRFCCSCRLESFTLSLYTFAFVVSCLAIGALSL